jgi:hypothetical protein
MCDVESLKKVSVEVIGVEPPCPRCKKTRENVEKAITKLEDTTVEFEVAKLNVASRATVQKYGALVPPAVAVNSVIKIMGRVPEAREIERILRKTM